MAKKDKTERPAWFHSDSQFEDHLAALERELEGRKNRLAELEALNAHPDMLAATQAEVDAAKQALQELAGSGQRTAAKRPAKKGQSR